MRKEIYKIYLLLSSAAAILILHSLSSQQPTVSSLPRCEAMSVFRASDRACYVPQGE